MIRFDPTIAQWLDEAEDADAGWLLDRLMARRQRAANLGELKTAISLRRHLVAVLFEREPRISAWVEAWSTQREGDGPELLEAMLVDLKIPSVALRDDLVAFAETLHQSRRRQLVASRSQRIRVGPLALEAMPRGKVGDREGANVRFMAEATYRHIVRGETLYAIANDRAFCGHYKNPESARRKIRVYVHQARQILEI